MCNPPLPWTWPFPDPPSVCETSISSSFRSLSFIKPTPCTFLPLNHHFSGKHKIVSSDSNEPLDLGSGTKRQSCKKRKFYNARNLKDWLPHLPLKTGKSKENQSFFITQNCRLDNFMLPWRTKKKSSILLKKEKYWVHTRQFCVLNFIRYNKNKEMEHRYDSTRFGHKNFIPPFHIPFVWISENTTISTLVIRRSTLSYKNSEVNGR